jgi:hopene-associated glycosyltransferase HpnB
MLLLEILLGTVFIGWVALGVLNYWSTRGATVLQPDQDTTPLPCTPGISIIVAARNEEKALSATLESLLKLDYPDYEVVLVDDESTDRTGLIADKWARRPESAGKLKVIHNRELPAGWRGKVHALHLAAMTVGGEWILATDADLVFHPAILHLAVSCALRKEAHLLSLFPEVEFGSFAMRVVLPAFALLLSVLFPLRLVNDPKSSRALAAGGFILMRRDDFEALGGYARLRDVVIEALGLAKMFKKSGRRIYVAFTRGLFCTRMYHGWRETWEGLSRSAFEGVGFSMARVLAGVIGGNCLAVLPWVSALAFAVRVLQLGMPWTADPALVLALATWLASALVYLPCLTLLRVSPLYVFTLPLACVFYSGVALNSVWVSVMGRGVPWKGRHYRPPA